MGKLVKVDRDLAVKVTGVAQDAPANSHLDFDLVIPLENYKERSYMTTWINNGLYTYVQLDPTVSEEQVERNFPRFMDKHMGLIMKESGYQFTLSLTPLRDIYFEQAAFDSAKHGDKRVVYIFLSIAILILLVACINFMNLSTVRAVERSKEIGVRKVLGAVKGHLVWQFIGESLLLTAFSCVLSVGLLALFLPIYKQLLGYPLNLSVYAGPIVLFLIGIMVVAGFLSGSYPAFVLAAFSPIQALKGKLRLGKGGVSLRQVLVVVQFSISILLMLGTAIGTQQMSYLKNKQLGYNKEQTLVVPIDNEDTYTFFLKHKSELLAQSRIEAVSTMSGEPGGFFDGHMFDVEAHANRWKARTEFADFDYVKTLGLKLIAGRDFSPQYPTDTARSILINRTAATRLGWTPEVAIGKWLKNTLRDTTRRTIIGVVEDFNFLSLKEAIEPLVIAPNDDRRAALIKLRPGNLSTTVETIRQLYAKTRPAYPFEYHFLDQQFDQLYQTDLRQQTILSVFASLAIFIACLGLFGLASFSAQQRTKEIGVRKVLGASVSSVVTLLFERFPETGGHCHSDCQPNCLVCNESVAAKFCVPGHYFVVGVCPGGCAGHCHRPPDGELSKHQSRPGQSSEESTKRIAPGMEVRAEGYLMSHTLCPCLHASAPTPMPHTLTAMLLNHLKIAWRTLRKQQGLTFINVFGLAVGLACCVLIMLYVQDELSYDRYNAKADRIYRINTDIKFGGTDARMAVSADPVGPTLKKEYPQVEQFVRLHQRGTWLVKRAGEAMNLREDNITFADSTLFDVFTLPLVAGNPNQALAEPNTVVISESAARRHFGNQNPMGQSMVFDNNRTFKVSGVMQDMPKNAHFHSDFFLSMLNDDYQWGQWLSTNHHTYIVLKPGTDPIVFSKNMDAVITKYAGPQAMQMIGVTMDQFRKAGNRYQLSLTPLTDIHLRSRQQIELAPNGDIQYVYIFLSRRAVHSADCLH